MLAQIKNVQANNIPVIVYDKHNEVKSTFQFLKKAFGDEVLIEKCRRAEKVQYATTALGNENMVIIVVSMEQ